MERNDMNRVYQLWSRYGRLQPGQTMAEYGLIVALVAIVAISAWALLGSNIKTAIDYISSCI
jgi:Flp pilus assembly pilin Flp